MVGSASSRTLPVGHAVTPEAMTYGSHAVTPEAMTYGSHAVTPEAMTYGRGYCVH